MAVLPHERQALVADVRAMLLTGRYRAVIGGQTGVGKTFVLDALVESLGQLPGIRVLHARVIRTDSPAPYDALRDLFGTVDLGVLGLPSPQYDALMVTLGRAVGDAPPTSLIRLAADAVLRALSRDGKIIVAIDGLDNIDDESHDLLMYISDRPRSGGYGASYVGTITSDQLLSGSAPSFDLAHCAVEDLFDLPPLTRAAFGIVVAQSARRPVSAVVIDELFDKSGGNPLWAFELLYQSPPGGPLLTVPASVADQAAARLAGAAPASLEILGALSLLGSSTRDELERMLGVTPAETAVASAAGLVLESGGRLSSAHPVLGGAARDRLGADRARELHRLIHDRADDLLTRAEHLDRATDPGPDEAIAELLHEAGTQGVGATAVTLLRRAVTRSEPTSDELITRELALADALFAQGELEESTRILRALDFETLPIEHLDTALPLGLMAFSARDGDAQTEVFLRRLHSRAVGDPVRSAVLTAYLAEAELDPAGRRQLATDALAQLRSAGAAPLTRHRAIGSLIAATLDAGLGLDSALLHEAKELEELVDAVALNDSADGQTALYSYQVGDLESSRRALELVRSRATESEELLMAGIFGVHLAAVHVFAGRMDAATAVLADVGELDAFTSPPPSVVAARGLVLLRQVDEAPLRALVAQPHVHGSEVAGAVARAALSGIAAARRQRWEEAVHELSRARRLSREAGVEEPGRRLWVDFALARTLIQLGRVTEAAEIRDTLADLSRGTRPLLDGVVARLDGLLAAHDGRTPESLSLLRQSVGLLTSAGFPTEVALSLLDLGRILHAARLRAEADETLTRAAEIALAAGDEQLAAIIAQAKAQTAATSVTSVLSDREQIIAEDAARGRTNREIAETHFLSVRTVETQLSSAYRKLGVRSRSELTALLARELVA